MCLGVLWDPLCFLYCSDTITSSLCYEETALVRSFLFLLGFYESFCEENSNYHWGCPAKSSTLECNAISLLYAFAWQSVNQLRPNDHPLVYSTGSQSLFAMCDVRKSNGHGTKGRLGSRGGGRPLILPRPGQWRKKGRTASTRSPHASLSKVLSHYSVPCSLLSF